MSEKEYFKGKTVGETKEFEDMGDTLEGSVDKEEEDMPEGLGLYSRKLDELKQEVKLLKKIKKQQEKISKLEDEKKEVLKEIERKTDRERKSRKHRKH